MLTPLLFDFMQSNGGPTYPSMRIFFALLVCFSCARPLPAQTPIIEADLTAQQADSLVALYNRAGTTRMSGDSRLAPQSDTHGDVGMLGGELVLAGRVRGSIVVINGSMRFEAGAHVDGDVHVIGGRVEGNELATAGSLLLYREMIRYDLRDGVLIHRADVGAAELRAGRDFDFGRTEFVVAARGGYNRVEGLPVHLGPRLRLGHSNPTVVESTIILRTADLENPGYTASIKQFMGGKRAAHVGVRWVDEVQPIEDWSLSDRENSLATFLMHRDYRDHYVRAGWVAYLNVGRDGLPSSFTVGYSKFDVSTAAVKDPFTLFYNNRSWRAQPFQQDTRYTVLFSRFTYDTRNDRRDPAAGWSTNVGIDMQVQAARYRYGIVDVRRYARLSPNAKISMRGFVAGSINGDSLPVFKQQTLGGDASLPAYELRQFDCGGDDTTVRTAVTPYYGCDRMALVQLEYQSNFRALSRVARRLGRDFGLLDNIRWVAFVNTGRAWIEEDGTLGSRLNRGTSDFVTDAGVGLRLGVFGLYLTTPLSERGNGAEFFVRLGPRL